MAAKPRSKAKSGRKGPHPKLVPLVEKLRQEVARVAGGDARGASRFSGLMAQLHRSRAPEDDKLLEKDRMVIDITHALDLEATRQFLAHNITRAEANLFLLVILALNAIEDVLWELKGHKPDEPKPEPRPLPEPKPSPKPTPRPSPGGKLPSPGDLG
jgi:hypothetical protein